MSVQGIDQADWLKSLLETSGAAETLSGTSSSGKTKNGEGVDFSSALMQQIDADQDGKISADEMKAGASKAKNALSSLNGIGSQMRAFKSQGSTSSIVNNLDANGGGIDIVESGLKQSDFAKIDLNSDGKLSSDEIQALVDKANGSSSSTKLKASKEDCVNILGELQTQGLAKQYEASVSASEEAA